MCGASASSEATRCEHCGARLATVACPSCFGMLFVGAKFCSHCGAPADRTELKPTKRQLCPRCQIDMNVAVVGRVELRECPKCDGIWADADSLQQICADREKQAAVLGMASNLSESDARALEKIRYLPCPVCKKLMNRVNFARCSHVVVDVCSQHGTWLDKDELRRIVDFIRAGGMETARARELAEIEAQRERLKSAQTAGAWDADANILSTKYGARDLGISAVAEVLKFLMRK